MSECTPDELTAAKDSNGHLYCLSRGQAIGSTVRVISGLVSLTALVVVFILVARNVIRCMLRPPAKKWSLFATPADIYVFFILLFDTVQCIGRTLDVKWVKEGKVYTGVYCTAAGGTQQAGEAGSAQLTFAMAVHTFAILWFRKGAKARWVAASVVALVCLFNALFVGIGIALNKGDRPYEAPTTMWCWIGPNIPHSRAVRIAGEYAWIWTTLIGTSLFYVPLYFWARGNITINEGQPWKFTVHRRDSERPNVRSFGILALPIVYACTALPTSIGRWYGFAHTSGPHQITDTTVFAVSSIFGLTGFFNVLLLFARPEVLLFGTSAPSSARRVAHHPLPSDVTPDNASLADVSPLNHAVTHTPYISSTLQQRPVAEGSMGRASRRMGALPADDSDDDEKGVGMRQRPGPDGMRGATGYDAYNAPV